MEGNFYAKTGHDAALTAMFGLLPAVMTARLPGWCAAGMAGEPAKIGFNKNIRPILAAHFPWKLASQSW